MRVARQETLIKVPHLDGSLTAVHPFLNGNYFIMKSHNNLFFV